MRAFVCQVGLATALFVPCVASATTFVVDDAGDGDDALYRDGVCATASGTCTLRAALVEAELTPGGDQIHFDLPGPGPHRIEPATRYAFQSTGGVVVDGTTQPGYSGTPLVWIDGSSAASEFPLLWFERNPDAVVKGLALTGHEAVRSTLNDVTIEDCYIGIEPDGTTVSGASASALFLRSVVRARVRRNVIGGAGWFGVFAVDTEGSPPGDIVISDNLIGTDATGLAPAPNGDGVRISGGADALVTSNVIAANRGANVFLGASAVTLRGNLIGTDATGTRLLGTSEFGVLLINSPNSRIGGAAPEEGNVIGGATRSAIAVTAGGSTGNEVRGNYIGTDPSATAHLGNVVGISVAADANRIVDNVVANSADEGIAVVGSDTRRVTIERNRLRDNGGLGIDLLADGVTANDPGDPDLGPNGLQNFPDLASAFGGGSLELAGTLDSTPETTFVVEIFANRSCDPNGHGEAERFVGAFEVTTERSGLGAFMATLPSVGPGDSVSATATGPGGTSELSRCIEVLPPPFVDGDRDGVEDALDLCPGTVSPSGVPTVRLGVNRFEDIDGDGELDTTPPPGGGRGPTRSYTLEDTAGCTCEQIIDARGLGEGHRRFGCSVGVMDEWVAEAGAALASTATSSEPQAGTAGCAVSGARTGGGWWLAWIAMVLVVVPRVRRERRRRCAATSSAAA